MIVARHEVPRKRHSKEPSRRVRYDRTQLIPQVFLVRNVRCVSFGRLNTLRQVLSPMMFERCYAGLRGDGHGLRRRQFLRGIISILLRDTAFRNLLSPIFESVCTRARIIPYPTGRLFWDRCSRHFVPGYDHAVPPGRNTFRETALKLRGAEIVFLNYGLSKDCQISIWPVLSLKSSSIRFSLGSMASDCDGGANRSEDFASSGYSGSNSFRMFSSFSGGFIDFPTHSTTAIFTSEAGDRASGGSVMEKIAKCSNGGFGFEPRSGCLNSVKPGVAGVQELQNVEPSAG